MGKASQIDVEVVREALTVLGVSGGGGPDLSAQVAALEAAVTALQADVEELDDTVGDIEGAIPVQGQVIYAWVSFDGTQTPPETLSGRFVVNLERISPGEYRFSFGDLGNTFFGVLFSGTAAGVEVSRTSGTVVVDFGADLPHATIAILTATAP